MPSLPGALDATGRLKVTQAETKYTDVAVAGLTWATDVSISPLSMVGHDQIDFAVELNNAGGMSSAAKVTAEMSVDGGTCPRADDLLVRTGEEPRATCAEAAKERRVSHGDALQ